MERVYAVWIGRNTAFRGTDDLIARSGTAAARVALLAARRGHDYLLLAGMDEIEAVAVLAKLRSETSERLGLRIPPEALLKMNREAFARVIDHGLDQDEHFESAASALEAAGKHAEEAEERWARHGNLTEGWAWDKLTAAYETYWDTVNRTTGFFLEVLERRGVELPRPT